MSQPRGILQVAVMVSLFMKASANFQCAFQSCPTRDVQLTEGDPQMILPCDFNTPINSSSTTTGNYTYCNDASILVTQSTNYYTLESVNYTLDKSEICCFDNEMQSCAVCYNFNVYYKPRLLDLDLQTRTVPVFGERFTANCEVVANPLPVCEWTREVFQRDFAPLAITPDVVFTNNNCTITFNTLRPNHMGFYCCVATNMLGTNNSSLPTVIRFSACSIRSTRVDYIGPQVVTASVGDPVTFTCSVDSASPLTVIRFYFNNTSYLDPNYLGTVYSDIGIVVNSTYNMTDCSAQTTLLIKQFSHQFIGQYSCSVFLFTLAQEGDNVTFSLAVEADQQENSNSDTSMILLIAGSLGASMLLLSLIMITVVLSVVIRRRFMTSILRLPPPPYSPDLFQYDVFISHTQDTEDYVKTILKSGLMEKGYRVQTPVDYVVGRTTDDIMTAFTTSRYIIILFSASYDHHCLELQYAYNKVSKTHCNCLIPIKCGGVIPKKLQRITYADYDNDEVITRVEQTIGKPLHDH